MRFLSVCSGIEAASVAWSPLGWRAVAFSEIEPFPSAVLAHHYPDTPNHGDMTRFSEWPDHAIDLLCGGTPCQSFSVAGLRTGLADPRGNLMLTFGAIAARYRPRWLVWENVPGVLSSDGGRDFAAFLGLLGQLGYRFAYRVLDAQYFGVAQRRRRVFVVGCLGDWRRAAAVLFERHSLSGHPAPSREARQGVAGTIAGGARQRGGFSYDDVPAVGVARPLLAGGHANNPLDENLIAFDPTQITSATHRSQPQSGGPCHTLAKGAHAPAVAFNWQGGGTRTTLGYDPEARTAATLVKDQTQAIAFAPEVAGTMVARSSRGGGQTNSPGHQADQQCVATHSAVRRLTPRECERLQGFPDDYTRIPWRGKPAEECPDGPRYKALGNSWAVPCAAWIGRRIAAVKQLQARAA